MRVSGFLTGTLAVVALTPSIAGASTYCAGPSGGDCKASYPATGAGLQSALDAADAGLDIDGTPDTVRIGPGTFGAPGGFRTSGGDLSIVGAGETTILTSTAPPSPETPVVLALKPAGVPAASVRSLQVQLNSTVQAGGIFGFREVADVHVGGPGTLVDDGIQLPDGGRVTRTLIDPAAFKDGLAIDATSGVIEDTLIRMRLGAPADRANGVIGSGATPAMPSILTLRHVTILGDGSPNTIGVRAQVQQSSTAVVSQIIHVRDSLLHGLHTALSRQGVARNPITDCKSQCFDAVADIDTRYSSLAAGAVEASGPGAISPGPGDLNDPEPALAPDASIQAGSPLINAGDPAAPEAGDSATDLAGHERIQAGRRDIGALESAFAPAPAPAPAAPTGPVSLPAHQAPVISGLTLSHRRFRVGAPPRRGTTVRFTLSAPAGYTLRIDRVLAGRTLVRRGKPSVCRTTKARAKAARGKPCRSYKKVGVLARPQVSGAVSVAFSGRLGRKALRPGAYRLTVEARDGTGAAAQPRRVTFTVIG